MSGHRLANHESRRDCRLSRLHSENGSMIVIAMMFVLIFIAMGVALYWLIGSQMRATETERTDVKAFNVAEAGIDAGMLALKLAWPTESGQQVPVDNALLKTSIQGDETLSKLWDPNNPSEFIDVQIYDNVDAAGNTTSVPNPDITTRQLWDSNHDGRMFVDASANVDNDRPRILIQAEKQKWELTFPQTMALYANVVDSNGQGMGIALENGTPPALYDVHYSLGKGIDPKANVEPVDSPTSFDDIFNDALCRALEGLAVSQGTYYTSAAKAQTDLVSGKLNGKVVYIDVATAIEIASSKQIGTEDQPIAVVIDTRDAPAGTIVGWDMKGSADFWGILVTIGNSILRGTCSTHGALYCSGTLKNAGNGSSEELYYNAKVIMNINREYTISVNIVPNTWEEYTLPRTSTTVAGG